MATGASESSIHVERKFDVSISKELAQELVRAAVAAIEVYSKPNFLSREEAFSGSKVVIKGRSECFSFWLVFFTGDSNVLHKCIF